MKCEIISIGTELTSGQNLDTNSQWLSRQLAQIGIPVGWHTTIADDLEDNIAAFQIASERAALVLVTGGLGPTQDDLTREVLARVSGVDLIFDPASFEKIQQMFTRRNRTMPERNRVQAMFPAGAEIIPNECGTAPGIWLQIGNCILAAMPGVPLEMYAMFENAVRPRLLKLGMGGGIVLQRKINCFGTGESAIEEKLLDVTRRGHVPEVGITVNDATISLRILARGPDPETVRMQIEPVEKTIRERLGNLVFGTEEDQLQDVVVRLLSEKRLTLATAEGVTAGLLAQRLGQVAGASAWFRGGLVAYDNRVKMQMLAVPQHLIEQEGTVSAAVAESMAIGCQTRFNVDLALSTVGIAGPGGGTTEKSVGLVYVGLAWRKGYSSQQFNWAGTRLEIQSRTAKLALNKLRLHLLQ